MKLFLGLIVVGLLGNTYVARACDYCIAAQGISPVELGSSGIRYDFRHLRLAKVYQGSSKVDNPQGLVESFTTHQIGFNYRPAEDLTFSLLVPITWRSSQVQYELTGDATIPKAYSG